MECAGVNYTDLLMLSGKYNQKPKVPYTPGFAKKINIFLINF